MDIFFPGLNLSGELKQVFNLFAGQSWWKPKGGKSSGLFIACSRQQRGLTPFVESNLQVLAINEMGEGVFATPAVCDGTLYVRTHTALHAFAEVGQ